MEKVKFPGVNHTYEANYGGDFIFHLHFESETSMTLIGLKGRFKGVNEKEAISITPIRPNVFLVSWQEANKSTVVEVQDFENGTVFANATMPDLSFERLKGNLTELQ